jgi:hypothetical protein
MVSAVLDGGRMASRIQTWRVMQCGHAAALQRRTADGVDAGTHPPDVAAPQS